MLKKSSVWFDVIKHDDRHLKLRSISLIPPLTLVQRRVQLMSEELVMDEIKTKIGLRSLVGLVGFSFRCCPLCLSGMEEAHCDRTEFLSNYPLNIDEVTLIPGSLGRIRPRDPKSTTCKTRLTTATCLMILKNTRPTSFSCLLSFTDDPKVVVANLTVSTTEQNHNQIMFHFSQVCLRSDQVIHL